MESMISTEEGSEIDLSEKPPQNTFISIRLSLEFTSNLTFSRDLQVKRHFELQVFLKPEKLEGNGRLKPENGIGVIKKST
jgi:hypothetical protein